MSAVIGLGILSVAVAAQSIAPEPLRNKATIAGALAAWRDGTGSPYDLLADDAVDHRRPVASKTYDSREAFMRDVIRPFNARMSSGLRPEVRHLYADGDTVVAPLSRPLTPAGPTAQGLPTDVVGEHLNRITLFDDVQGVAPAAICRG